MKARLLDLVHVYKGLRVKCSQLFDDIRHLRVEIAQNRNIKKVALYVVYQSPGIHRYLLTRKYITNLFVTALIQLYCPF